MSGKLLRLAPLSAIPLAALMACTAWAAETTPAVSRAAPGTDRDQAVTAADRATFTAGALEIVVSAQSLSVAQQGKPLFELPARVAVDVEDRRDQDLFTPAFRRAFIGNADLNSILVKGLVGGNPAADRR